MSRLLLNGVIESLAKITKKRKNLQLNGFSGADLFLEANDKGTKFTAWVRLLVVNGRLYQVIVAADAKVVEKVQAARFLDSFKLHEKTVPPLDEDRPPEEKPLIEQIENLNGYTIVNKSASGRKVLTIHFRDPGIKDADLKALRPLLQKATMPLHLVLSLGPITNAGLLHLKNLATLSGLGLGGQQTHRSQPGNLIRVDQPGSALSYQRQNH